MKIAIVCQSLLLSKALHSFLGEMVVPYKQCDFAISDQPVELDKPVFCISSVCGDLVIPFSKSTLIIELEKFYKGYEHISESKEESLDIPDVLEEKIAALTERFRKELIDTLRAYYGN